MALEIVYLSPHDLKPYDGNTRKHAPEDIDQIKASLQRESWKSKIRAAKEELKIAGPYHRKDLQKHIKRMQKELRLYDILHRKAMESHAV